MSWRATAMVKDIREGITRTEKLLLFTLADYHNDETGQCDPSLDRISAEALLSKRQTIRVLADLERKDLIRIRRRRDSNHQDSNQYDLFLVPPGIPLDSQTETLGDTVTPSLQSVFSRPESDMLPGFRVTKTQVESDIAVSLEPPGTAIKPKDGTVIPKKLGLLRRGMFADDIPHDFVDKMSLRFPRMRDLRDCIAAALAHKSAKGSMNLESHVIAWLMRNAEGTTGGNYGRPRETKLRPGERGTGLPQGIVVGDDNSS